MAFHLVRKVILAAFEEAEESAARLVLTPKAKIIARAKKEQVRTLMSRNYDALNLSFLSPRANVASPSSYSQFCQA